MEVAESDDSILIYQTVAELI